MSNRGQRFVFGLIATVVGAVLFEVASSYIVFRGYPRWLAAGVGAFAFPVGPLTWHLLAERKRKKKQADAKAPAKASLTSGDRYKLRFLVVALLVLGPMIAMGRFNVARAVWKKGLWWWPTSYEPTTSHGGPLSTIGTGTPRTIDVIGTPLARVPPDAELVVLVQPPPDDKKNEGHAILAWGDGQLMMMAEGKLDKTDKPEDMIRELNKARGKVPWLPMGEVSLISSSDSQVLAATDRWKPLVELPGMGPSTDILRELGRAPKDAFFVAGFVPKTTRDVYSTKSGAVWLYQTGEKLVFEGRAEMKDDVAAKQLISEATRALDNAAHDAPESCREQVGALIKTIKLDQTGAAVTGRVELDGGVLMGVMFCAMKDK